MRYAFPSRGRHFYIYPLLPLFSTLKNREEPNNNPGIHERFPDYLYYRSSRKKARPREAGG